MRLYNTLTKKIEDFIPNNKNIVKMYTCGPTVYNYAHIGNLRTYVFEDILEKGLTYLGYQVDRVMNITDVGHLTSDGDTGEDKMEKGAKLANKTVYEIADFYTKAFLQDMNSLNIKRPAVISSASSNINQYIKMIEKMYNDGFAYLSGGNVYFDISRAKDYYKLAGEDPESLMVGVRDGVESDNNKRNPMDFVLWFTMSKYENHVMKWDSPWGVGYPGWHIECSGIAIKYLGEYLDIHCGGVDNIFPHHTNEIAQSEAYLGHKWCNFWCHGAHLNDKSGKMSKSKGDILTINTLKEEGYDPITYRYFLINSHYRSQLVFDYDSLDNSRNALLKLKSKVASLTESGEFSLDDYNFYNDKFKEAIENDINTSLMLTVLYDVLKSNISDVTKRRLVEDFDKVLSLNLLKIDVKNISSQLEEEIKQKITERDEAKKEKDFVRADEIRDEMLSKGVKLVDTRDGTIYEIL